MADVAVRNAIAEALRIVGHPPDTYDVDSVLGTLQGRGIVITSGDEMTRAAFEDRCDFDCEACHPEDDGD